MSIIWKKESETHATSLCGRYSVYLWTPGQWVADCNGKAVVRPTKAEAKRYCEEKHQTR